MHINMCWMPEGDIVESLLLCELLLEVLLCVLKWKKMLMASPCQNVMNTTPEECKGGMSLTC